jgi:anti-anti-sigma regulatory factor
MREQTRTRGHPADACERIVDLGAGQASFGCRLDGASTVVTAAGSLDKAHSGLLADVLAIARLLRPRGAITVDLAETTSLTLPAFAVLRSAAADADRAGRRLTVRNLHEAAMTDPLLATAVKMLWPATLEPGRPARR